MIRAMCLLALTLFAASALAQEAPPAKPQRTLISVGYGSDFGIFVERPPANAGPQVEAWSWNILKDAKKIPGATYDMTVSREVINCTAGPAHSSTPTASLVRRIWDAHLGP